MRVLQVSCACAPLHPGGVARLVGDIGRALAGAGHRSAVFTLADPSRTPVGRVKALEADGMSIYALGQPTPDFFDRYRVEDYLNPAVHDPFQRVLDSFAPDLVHCHAIQGIGVGILDRIPSHVPVVLTMHDYWWTCPNLFLLRLDESPCSLRRRDDAACVRCLSGLAKLRRDASFGEDRIAHRHRYLRDRLRRFDRILAVSRVFRDRVAGFFPELAIDVCENGVCLNANLETIRRRRAERMEQSCPVRFGFFGGTSVLKGFRTLTRAMERLPNVDFRVDVYGCPTSWRRRLSERMPNVRRVYRRLRGLPDVPPLPGVDPRMRLRPPFSPRDQFRVLSEMDVLLAPSVVQESFSLVCREALACGAPVIATRCGGPEEVIRHGENGMLVDMDDAPGLANSMRRCVEDRALLRRLSDAARPDGIRSLDDQVAQLLNVYQDARAGG